MKNRTWTWLTCFKTIVLVLCMPVVQWLLAECECRVGNFFIFICHSQSSPSFSSPAFSASVAVRIQERIVNVGEIARRQRDLLWRASVCVTRRGIYVPCVTFISVGMVATSWPHVISVRPLLYTSVAGTSFSVGEKKQKKTKTVATMDILGNSLILIQRCIDVYKK